MDSHYFGGASQFAGGGFMPSPAATNENAFGGNQRRSGAAGKKEETVRVFTIKQILIDFASTEDDTFVLDNHPVANVGILGRVVDMRDNAARTDLKICDNTGTIDVQLHSTGLEGDEVMPSRRELATNTYVRVYGTVRTFQGQVSIRAYTIRTVEDFNEVSFHNLQVIFQHLYFTRGPPKATPPGALTASGATVAYPARIQGTGPYGGSVGTVVGAGGGQFEQTGDIMQDIFNVFAHSSSYAGSSGLDQASVEQQLKSQGMHYTAQQIREALGALAMDGRIYTTIDDQHWKACTDS